MRARRLYRPPFRLRGRTRSQSLRLRARHRCAQALTDVQWDRLSERFCEEDESPTPTPSCLSSHFDVTQVPVERHRLGLVGRGVEKRLPKPELASSPLQYGHDLRPHPSSAHRRMHPDPKYLGLTVVVCSKSAHANNVAIELGDKEVATRTNERVLDIGKIGKLRRRSVHRHKRQRRR